MKMPSMSERWKNRDHALDRMDDVGSSLARRRDVERFPSSLTQLLFNRRVNYILARQRYLIERANFTADRCILDTLQGDVGQKP